MKKLKIGQAVYIKTTNAVGRIINSFNDGYRTDTDGMRTRKELEPFEPRHLDFPDVHVPGSFNANIDRYNPDVIRKIAPGFIGGQEIAEKATDGEVVMLTEMQDHVSYYHNRIKDLQKQIKGKDERNN